MVTEWLEGWPLEIFSPPTLFWRVSHGGTLRMEFARKLKISAQDDVLVGNMDPLSPTCLRWRFTYFSEAGSIRRNHVADIYNVVSGCFEK